MIFESFSLVSMSLKLFCKLTSRVCETWVSWQNQAFETQVDLKEKK